MVSGCSAGSQRYRDDTFCNAISFHSMLMQMQHGAAVRQGELFNDCKVLGEGFAECGFGDVGVNGFAAANEFMKLRISWGNPFEDEMCGRQTAAKPGDTVHWDLAAEQEMMQNGQHHDRVEVTGATRE